MTQCQDASHGGGRCGYGGGKEEAEEKSKGRRRRRERRSRPRRHKGRQPQASGAGRGCSLLRPSQSPRESPRGRGWAQGGGGPRVRGETGGRRRSNGEVRCLSPPEP